MSEIADPARLFFDGITDYAVFVLDPEGRVNRWSSSASRMLGYDGDAMKGKHFASLYRSDLTDDVLNNDELEWAAAHGRFEDVGWRLRSDKTKFWADSVLCPIRDEAGKLQGYSLIIRDLTERKKAEEALRQKEEELSQARKMEAVGRLAGGVAHDFNNFITGIIGLVEDVRTSMGEQDPRRSDLDEILKTADQARALTKELLAFGRRQISTPQVIQLNSLLKEKQKLLMRLVGADVQLKMDLDPALHNILIDPTQLDQILINLVMNARDAMPQGGTIQIRTRHSEEIKNSPQAFLIISDTGTGIDERIMHRLFEPFFTTKDQGKGTGLGLASVYGIVKQNHGDIQVESKTGVGTTFTIQFPEVDVPVAAAPEAPAPSAAKGSETILVVEDTPVVHRVVTQALKKAGYQVLAATSGKEALAHAAANKGAIDLVLTDVIMPELGGPEMVQRLRQTHPGTSIIYMSAYAEELVQERGILQKDTSFIEKPFTQASLLLKVREVLDNRATSLANRPS